MEFNKVHYLTVGINNKNQRIDNFLFSYLKKVPKSMVYKIIRKGEVRVNSKRIKPTYKLKLDDEIRIPPVRFEESKILNPDAHLIKLLQNAVLFENDAFLLLNKPAGLPVHAGTGTKIGIIEILKSQDRDYIELVHRLDKGTSGCLLVAKTRNALLNLQESLKQGQFAKQYLALCYGKWSKKKNVIKHPIDQWRKRNGEKFMRVAENGKYAHSIFNVKKQYKHWSLVEVDLLTGRTHQIRVHASYEGHALAGDSKYCSDSIMQQAKKDHIDFLCLHAQKLRFTLDGKEYSFEAPLTERFKTLIGNLV